MAKRAGLPGFSDVVRGADEIGGESTAPRLPERRKRKSSIPTESAGEYLVMGELLGRGFDVEFAGPRFRGHDLLIRSSDSSPQRIQVRTVHSAPWYVRRSSFVGGRADQVTVCVLLEVERPVKRPRFLWSRTATLRPSFGSHQIGRPSDSLTPRWWKNTKITGIY
jgi:hypothetical protein